MLVQAPQAKGSGPNKTRTSDTSHQVGVPGPPALLTNWLQIQKVHMNPRFHNWLERHRTQERVYLQLRFIVKDEAKERHARRG